MYLFMEIVMLEGSTLHIHNLILCVFLYLILYLVYIIFKTPIYVN